jgi:Xaa-Pro aminopeptidase
MTKAKFSERRNTFSDQMEENSFALLASGEAMHKSLDQFFKFEPNRNFYYLTGLERENFLLFLAKDKDQYQEYIFIEEPSDFATKWLGKRMTKKEVSEISGIDEKNILYIQNFSSFLSQRVLLDSRAMILSKIPSNLYLDLFRYKQMKKPMSFTYFKNVIENYPELIIKDANQIICEQRRIKDKEEIEAIKTAIKHTKSGIESILRNAKPKVNEGQIEALFEYAIKLDGSKGLAFDTIVASGKNATVLHYVDNNQIVEKDTLVLLDLGARSGLYAGDISRTFPISGKFNETQKKYYQMVLDVNKQVIKAVKPGVYVRDLNQMAKDLLAEKMLEFGKIKDKSEIDKYYYHGVSHYLGLDVHDVGTYQLPLVPGTIITVEPGIYIEEESIGIRIEDNILVTENGYENLSKAIAKEISEIEELME